MLALLTILGLWWGSAVQAAVLEKGIKAEVAELYRDLSQSGFSPYKNSFDSFFVGNARFKLSEEAWQIELAPELRAIQSKTLAPSILVPNRFLDLETRLHHSSRSASYLDFDRLALSYSTAMGELTLGRKPVSLGVLKYMPVWNKFSRPLPFSTGIPQVFGADQLDFRFQKQAIAGQLLSVLGPSARHDSVHLAEFTYYAGSTELHALFADWLDHPSAGLALAQDIHGATMRAEILHTNARASSGKIRADIEAQTQAGAGIEYAFTEKLSGVSEFLFLSQGKPDNKNYDLILLDRLNPGLRARWYGLAQLNYQLTAFWLLGLGSFKNLVDPSQYFLFHLHHSISDGAEISFSANIPTGSDGGEFSRKTFQFPNGAYKGAETSAQLLLSLAY